MPRVALFTGAYNHIADGVALTLNRLVAHLERRGVPVRVFAPTTDAPAIADHAGTLVPVHSVAAPGRSDYRVSLGITPSVRAALQAFEPTLFHVATPDLLGRHALGLADTWGVPAVASYHTHFTSYLKYYYLGFLEEAVWSYLRRFYARCRHVYVPSPAMADVLRGHGLDDNLRLWPRGVDTDRFSPDRRALAWRRAHGIGDDEVVVSFVSRLVWEKGLDVFADVIARLDRAGVPHRCLVVGDGPARDDLADQLPDGAVLTGYLGGTDLATAYASSDVFLFPSDTETFGSVTLEAMASGVPTVCADAAGSRSLVEDGVTGRLCPPGDTDAFYEATRALVTDATARRAMGEAALDRAHAFRWDAVLDRMIGFYEEALGHRHALASAPATASAFDA